jgi:hypothetical protein
MSGALCSCVHGDESGKQMSMEFVLKHYKKGASIQLKPKQDISTDPARCVHFSIAWFKDATLSKEEQRRATALLFERLSAIVTEKQGRLTFRVVKACENCTYGHFDEEFEAAVVQARKETVFCADKNLPLEKHTELPQDVPIMFHIAHSRSIDASFNERLKVPGAVLALQVELLEVNK